MNWINCQQIVILAVIKAIIQKLSVVIFIDRIFI